MADVRQCPYEPVSNRLDVVLQRDRPALICYLPLGDPAIPADVARVYVSAGVDVLEIGVPVPNPYVDGATITASMSRALGADMTLARVSRETAALRAEFPDQAMVWMGYGAAFEPGQLVREAAYASLDGVLFVEPARFFAPLAEELARHEIHLLHFLSRDLPPADVSAATRSGGYLMLQGVAGSSGAGEPSASLPDSGPLIRQLRREQVKTPVAIGIGITTAAQARCAVAMGAAGVVIGSAVVEHALRGTAELSAYLGGVRSALR